MYICIIISLIHILDNQRVPTEVVFALVLAYCLLDSSCCFKDACDKKVDIFTQLLKKPGLAAYCGRGWQARRNIEGRLEFVPTIF